MSDGNIPLGTTPLPEYCQFVGSDKILCVYGEESVECKVLGDNKFVCGEEKKDCEIIEGHLGCAHIAKLIPIKSYIFLIHYINIKLLKIVYYQKKKKQKTLEK